MKIFESKIRTIFFYVGEYGIRNKRLDFSDPNKITHKDRTEFIIQVHKGFRIGQEMILKEILPLLSNLKGLNSKRKIAKQAKNKELVSKCDYFIQRMEYRILILRHFIDYVAWQMMNRQYYIARRYYSGSNSRPDLLNTNLESVIDVANQYHKLSELNFCLIADLSTFIDIGDILLTDGNELKIMEIKEGKKTKEVLNFINQISDKDFDPSNMNLDIVNHKFLDQVERTIKQYVKGQKLIEFIKNESGEDPFINRQVEVITPKYFHEFYHLQISDMITESKKKGFAYGSVEDIIFIGVYRGKRMRIGREIMKMLNEKFIENPLPVIDYLAILTIPMCEPLFFKHQEKNDYFDLLFGKMKIYFTLNIEKLIELFNKNGISASWVSRKETHKLLNNENKFQPFTFKNRAIKIKSNNQEVYLGDAFIVRLLLDNMTPTSFVKSYL